MEQIAFLMRLKPGHEAEYKKRHDDIWPELKEKLSVAGIRDYSIFLNRDTGDLFAVLRLDPHHSRDLLPREAIMKKWWDHMAPLMDVDATNKPIERPLECVFHMD